MAIMKKMVLSGTILALMSGVSMAASWRLVELYNQDEAAYFMDKSSLKRDGDSVTAWVMTAKGGAVVAERSTLNLMRVNCKRDMLQLVATYTYSDEGKTVRSDNQPTTPIAIIPDTIMDSLAKHMCGIRKLAADVFLDPVKTTKLFYENQRSSSPGSESQ